MKSTSRKINEVFPELSKDWEQIFIEEIRVFRSKEKVIVSINSEKPLTDEEIIFLEELFKGNLNELEVEIESYVFELENKEEEIKSFINRELDLNNFNFHLEVNDSSARLVLFKEAEEKKITELKEFCNSLGFSITVYKKYEDQNIKKFIDKIEYEEKELKNSVQVVTQTPKKKAKINPSEIYEALVYKKPPKYDAPEVELFNIEQSYGPCTTSGVIFKVEYKEIQQGKKVILTIFYSDFSESIYTKIFLDKEESFKYEENLKIGMGIKVIGEFTFDPFTKSSYIKPAFFEVYKVEPRKDLNEEKRVELHLHTGMSAQDGISNARDYIERAKYWGHKSIAITDHSVVQAFPEAMNAVRDNDIKIIYGMEINLVDDYSGIIKDKEFLRNSFDNFVVFDVETTGFSAKNDKIIEIGAVKIKDWEIIDSFNVLIDPKEPLPDEIIALTGITDSMLVGKPEIKDVVEDFKKFIDNSVLVAHNASFDIGFLKNNFEENGISLSNPYIDTLELSRIFNPTVRSHSLKNLAKRLGVSLENAHRAVDDARATGEVFIRLLDEEYRDSSFSLSLDKIETLKEKREKHMGESFHAVVLAKDLVGLKNLYKLVSLSHMEYFNYSPKIPKSILDEHREGLLIGSACQDGEVFQSIIKNYTEDRIRNIAKYYDYLEIQPIANSLNLIPEYFSNEEELREINKSILNLGDELEKIVVATGDAHYLDEELKESRRILKHSLKMNRDEYDNDLHFLTTDEMIEEFSYLGNRAFEVVIKNTNKISDQIQDILPIPKETFPPIIEGSDKMLTEMTMKRAHEIYGDILPENIESRIKTELDSIIKNGYSVMYIIAQKLVQKSNDDGYQVGSRGSVGSSIVATLAGITEVNPLPPHYSCPECKYSEFIDSQKLQIFSGSDLPDKNCPECSTPLNKYGDEIPFEVFLGFEGEKEPDIDLNFAGEYQTIAHKYTEELFGSGKVFRAGTIGTIAEKTAYGYVLKFIEEKGIKATRAEIDRLANSLVGVKRTTGQHAGGIMIVPEYKDIHDFSPIQYPANKNENDVITTHYDYKSISENILKLDILGHDVPTMIKMIEDLTKTDFMKAPLNDKKVLSIFNSADVLEMDKNIFDSDIGTLGIPEFGTNFVQKMLKVTMPSSFAELVQISGLSHGTNVWADNAEELVNSGKATLKEVISTREDIMQDLINAGADKKFAFFVMEKVRKGKNLSPDEEEIISKLDLPNWYIDSLNKISYMFPKAHAVAYVTMAVRMAYYKVYYPEAFYATYLSTKNDFFDLGIISQGPDAIIRKLKEIKTVDNATKKEQSEIPIYEIALEMFARGCKLGNLEFNKSRADKFTIADGEIIPPFRVVPNLGLSVANSIVSEREKEEFLSIEDMRKRTKISATCVEYLKSIGVLNGLSDTNQLSLF